MRNMSKKIKLMAFSSLLVLVLLADASFAQGFQPLPPEYAARVPQKIKDQLTLYSGSSFLISAKEFGITNIAGKDISIGGSPPGNAKGKKFNDVSIGKDPVKHENEPTVAVNPKDKTKLVAGSHSIDEQTYTVRCVAYRSTDGGTTWSIPIEMKQLELSSQCSDPVIAYAPDGNRVYYAYMDIKFDFNPDPPYTLKIDFDIVKSHSDDNGATWSDPTIALDGKPTIIEFELDPFNIVQEGFDYDKPWIGTHIDTAGSNNVYVTATKFDEFAPYDCHIAFARSTDKGVNWNSNSPTILDSSSGGCGNPVVQGSRPTGGPGGNVLVAWYNSGDDGWLDGKFKIRTASSADNGQSFGSANNAVIDAYEAPFWLGPFGSYYRWWATMFPDVEIDSNGGAHIAYTNDPTKNPFPGFSDNPEDGNIRYISSSGPPYNAWSSPVTVNDDGMEKAQGFAALETDSSRSSGVHVTWLDHRLSPVWNPNSIYDIFYSRKLQNGWLKNFRISDVSSMGDYEFIGDYIDLTANDKLLFTIWTDRRHQPGKLSFEDNVFGSKIGTG